MAQLSAMGLLSANVEGTDYFEDLRQTEVADNEQNESNAARVRRILSALAGCAINKENAPEAKEDKEDVAVREARLESNRQLDSIIYEGINLYIELGEGSSPEVDMYFEKRRLAEMTVFQHQDTHRTAKIAKNEAHQAQINEWIKGSRNRAIQLQIVACQIRKFASVAQQ